jgi:hypothetical protein
MERPSQSQFLGGTSGGGEKEERGAGKGLDWHVEVLLVRSEVLMAQFSLSLS